MKTDSSGQLRLYLPANSSTTTADLTAGGTTYSNYYGTVSDGNSNVLKMDQDALSVSTDKDSYTYGEEITVSPSGGSVSGTPGYTYYDISTGNQLAGKPSDAGSYKVSATLSGNAFYYDTTATANFKITPKSIKGFTAGGIANQTYTGGKINPSGLTVSNPSGEPEATLAEGSDYTNVGTGKTVTISGTGNYTGSITQTFNIVKRAIALTLSAAPDGTAKVGSNISLTAAVSNAVDLQKGTVTFKYGNIIKSGCAISQNGDGAYTATTAWEEVPIGSYNITAEYVPADNDNYECTKSGSITGYSVTKYEQADFTISSGSGYTINGGIVSKTYGDGDFTLQATGHLSSDAVKFSSSNTSVASVDDNGKVTILKSGEATITATSPSDDRYNQATAQVIVQVAKANQTGFGFTSGTDYTIGSGTISKTYGVGDFTLQTAGHLSSNDVTFSSSNTSVASVDGNGKVSILKFGETTITVTSPGDDRYNQATAQVTIQVVSGADYTSDNTKITVSTENNTTTATIAMTAKTGTDGTAASTVTAAQISDALEKAAKKAASQGADKQIIEISVGGASSAKNVSATIPQTAFNNLAQSDADALTIKVPVGSVTFDSTALDAINKNALGSVTVMIAETDTASLTKEEQAAIGDRPVYGLPVSFGGKTISDFGGGAATVSVPYKLADGEDASKIVVYCISDSGELIMVPDCIYDAATGMVTFTTTHFSAYAVGYNDVSFTDVSGWYEDYVYFLAARDVISGTDDSKFSPDENITRAQFVTILANLSGDDLCGYTTSSFADVTAADWYFTAVQWAYKKGIAAGADGKFSPDDNITRQDIAVMIARYADKAANYILPKTNGAMTFTDSTGIVSYASNAVTAMQRAGIISGNCDGSFAPLSYATRAQAATMIARLLQGMIS